MWNLEISEFTKYDTESVYDGGLKQGRTEERYGFGYKGWSWSPVLNGRESFVESEWTWSPTINEKVSENKY